MRFARFALFALVACTIHHQPQPVRPQLTAPACQTPMFVGNKVERHISWNCDIGQEGRRGTNTDGRCISAVTTTAWCNGNPCTTSVRAVPEYNGYNGRNVVEIVPQVPGPLEAWVELRHEVGLVEKFPVHTCEVMPVPDVVMTCKVRDAATGAYVPCSAVIPSGVEVHLEMTATLANSRGPLPSIDAWLDGTSLDINPLYGRGAVECTRTEDDPSRRAVRCTIAAAAPGSHTFTTELRPLPKQSMSFVVAQP